MNHIAWAGSLLLFSTLSVASSNNYFVCTDSKGHKTFSQSPCPQEQKSQTKKFKTHKPSYTQSPSTKNASTKSEPTERSSLTEMKLNIKRRELQSKIDKHQKKIDRLEAKERKALEAIPAYEVRIGQRINAKDILAHEGTQKRMKISSKYKALIQKERNAISDLQLELRELEKSKK
jgi:hypothetical protein